MKGAVMKTFKPSLFFLCFIACGVCAQEEDFVRIPGYVIDAPPPTSQQKEPDNLKEQAIVEKNKEEKKWIMPKTIEPVKDEKKNLLCSLWHCILSLLGLH